MPRNLADLSVTERERHLAAVRQECIEFREPKRSFWLDAWRLFRQLQDPGTPARTKFVSSYAWSAVQSQMALLEPLFFSSMPTWDLTTPREEDLERNGVLEQLLTQQVHHQTNLRGQWSRILLEALVFGSSFPWTYWKTEHKRIGPIYRPLLDAQGRPILDIQSGKPIISELAPEVRTHHAPYIEHVDLWHSFIHPDGRRGFSRRMVSGYDLIAATKGENALYDASRVRRMLDAAARAIASQDPSRGQENYHFGDDQQVVDDELALEAGTQVGQRLEEWRMGLLRDAMAMTFPILHYDDGFCSGTYALNVDSRLYELRFNPYAAPDGAGYRMAVVPNSSPQEVFGVGFIEAHYDLLKVYDRFLQLATDGANLTVHPTWRASQRFDQVIGEVFTGPGLVNIIPTLPGESMDLHLDRMDLPQSWIGALQFRDALKDELDQAFASNESTMGRFTGGRKTAQEVSQVLQFSQSRAQLLADRIADHFATPLGRKWLAMSSTFMTPADMEDVLGAQGRSIKMPDPEEIIRTMQVVFRGSVISSNNAAKLGQIQGVAQAFLNALQFLPLPHVNEFFRDWLRLAGLEGVLKKLPAPQPGLTAFDLMVQKGAASPTGGGLPSTPTDLSGMLSAAGGATAPPGPAGGV